MGLNLGFVNPQDPHAVRRAFQTIGNNLNATKSPTFAGLTLTGLTASRLIWANASKALASKDLVDLIAGTTNRVTVADDAAGGVTLSGPQDIHTAASPTFADLTLSAPVNIYALSHDSFADFVAGEHFLQTAITNVSTALSTGLLKVTTGTGALSVITDNSANWNTAYGWGNHAGLYDTIGTAAGLIATHEATYVHADIALNTTHRGLTAGNPHSVTKSEVGLGSVENTALSTWAGSTNLTTLGTIVTGTWNGTTVAIANGGTGQITAQTAINALTQVSAATNEHVLTKDTVTGNAIWKAAAGGVSNHAILDGSVHTDSVAQAVTRGSIIYGNATPKWDELAIGAANTFLGSDGTDLSYRTAAQVMVSLSGAAGADFSMNSHKITSVTDPTAAQDAATKNYSDNKHKNICRMRLGTSMTSLTSGVWTLVTVDTDVVDPDNVSDTANNKIIPNQEGYYSVVGLITWTGTYVVAGNVYTVGLFKNGAPGVGETLFTNQVHSGVTGSGLSSITPPVPVYFNGTTDYVQLYAIHYSGTRTDIDGGAEPVTSLWVIREG